MSKDGPPPSRLSERMAERVESEKRLIEAHQAEIASMLASERAKLAESLKAESLTAQSAMQISTQAATAEMQGFVSTLTQELDLMKAAFSALKQEEKVLYRKSLEAENKASREAYRALLKGSRPVAVVSAVIFLTGASVLVGVNWWSARSLSETLYQVAAEEKNLADLRTLTGRVQIIQTQEGPYVVLPEGTSLATTYTCGDRTCLRLPGT